MKTTGKEEIAQRIYNQLEIDVDIIEEDKAFILDEIIYSLEKHGFFTLVRENSLQQ